MQVCNETDDSYRNVLDNAEQNGRNSNCMCKLEQLTQRTAERASLCDSLGGCVLLLIKLLYQTTDTTVQI